MASWGCFINKQKTGGEILRRLSLSKKGELLENGKEDSYERNPGGVSFVLNLSFSELFKC